MMYLLWKNQDIICSVKRDKDKYGEKCGKGTCKSENGGLQLFG